MIGSRFAPVLRELQPLTDRFAAAGHRLFLVGGTVRDILLADMGEPHAGDEFDIDATTTATPDEIKRCLNGWADAVWTQGERFGTIGAMKRVPGALTRESVDRVYEITTHRAETYRDDSRKPDVEFSFDIEADLSRRDFTVNAMAIELTRPPRGRGAGPASDGSPVGDGPELLDPFGGRGDLAQRVLRTPIGPEASFSDDPLRMLRAARFIARYGLRPEESLVRAVRAMSDRLQIVSAERIRDELDKLLAAPQPAAGLCFVIDTGLMEYVVPELTATTSQPDQPCHPNVWAHIVELIDAIEAPAHDGDFDRRLVRLAALLHPLGAARSRKRLGALRHSNDDVREVVALIEGFPALVGRLTGSDDASSTRDIRRHVRDAGRLRPALHALVRAQIAASGETVSAPLAERLDDLEDRIVELAAREPLDDLGPQLDGAEVMAVLGIGPGRAVGGALQFLQTVRLDEGVLSDELIRSRLETWWAEHGRS